MSLNHRLGGSVSGIDDDHKLDSPTLSLGTHWLVRSMSGVGNSVFRHALGLKEFADGISTFESEMMVRLVSVLGLFNGVGIREADQLDRSARVPRIEFRGNLAQ